MAANHLLKPITILLWNANGILNNINELQLSLIENQVDIAMISETHLTNKSTLKMYGYNILRADHPDGTAHGGAALIISNKIAHTPSLPCSSLDMQIIDTSLHINSIPVTIASAYLPPGRKFPDNELLLYLTQINHSFLLGADFNAKHHCWGCSTINTRGRALQNLILTRNAKVLAPRTPTYWPSHQNRNPDFLDFFISSLPNHLQTKLTNINDPASDHTPVLIQINASISSHNNNNSSKIIWPRFRTIMTCNTNLNIKLKSHADIDNAISTFTETILNAKKNASFPLHGSKSDHLITPEIRQLIIEKRRARNRWQHSHYPEDRRNYNSLSNKLKSVLKTHKNELYKSHLASLSPSNGSLWKKTKSLLQHKETLPPLLRDDNSLAVDDQDKADLLASHLADSFKPHSSLPSQNHIDLVETYLISPLPMALPAKHTTPAEVSNIIKNLKNNKSPGHDQISNKIIKNLPPKSIIWLTYIFNALLRLSYFPPTWKNSIIITILKPGKPSNNPSSYRPISLLPAFGKMFEKIILKRLMPIVQNENILPDIQFGFRSRHSTTHQLHRVTDFVSSALESKKYCSGVFLDVAKAFDTVWHHGLLFKLKKIFPAPYYLLLKSYLENRSFRVRINTRLSTHHEVQAGVPQGSDIAPFLYIFYTADIPVSQFTLIGTYADDTAILASSVDPILASHQIQSHLNILMPWFNKWGIKINETKSSHITFSFRPHDCPPIIMNNSTIPHCTSVKYLGLTFDRKLTWGPHLKDKRKQLNSRLHLLRPLLRSNINIQNKILIYKCLLRPLWTYGIVLWGPTKKSNAKTIQAFQSICLRIIAKAPWYVTNKLLHDDLQIKTVHDTATNFYKRFHEKLLMNHNHLISQLASKTLPDNPTRRLKRNWCRDLLIL